jgi:disulfide bond formation protein DsbB
MLIYNYIFVLYNHANSIFVQKGQCSENTTEPELLGWSTTFINSDSDILIPFGYI